MSFFKFFMVLFLALQITICNAQNFPFIPSDQHQLTDKQLENTQINIGPAVLLFSEHGELLSMSQMSLMTNPEYKPLFYANSKGKLSTVVFIKKSSASNIIEKNPEAAFTYGEKAKDFIGTDLNGNSIKLSELKGRIVVLNFWFTKCGPCIMEMPDLNELASMYKDKNVVFLAITFNEKELVEQFLESNTFNYAILTNAKSAVNIYNVKSYPTNMIINQQGEIVLKELGYRTNIKEVLANSINSLL